MFTTRETVRLLCKSIITRLENQKAITFNARLRQIVQDEVAGLISPYIVTDEEIRERTIAKIGASSEALENSEFTESDQYKTAKALVRKALGDDELNGFYFQKPVREVVKMITAYLMRSSHIDDVYETDDVLEHKILEFIKKFDADNLH